MPSPAAGAALALFIRGFIERFLATPDNNQLGTGTSGKAWDGCLVGFSNGADDLYAYLKRHVGDFHWTPAEAFALGTAAESGAAPAESSAPAGAPTSVGDRVPGADQAAAAAPVPGADLTVVSWALCAAEEIKIANRQATRFPSEPWARARIFGQRGNRALHRALVKALNEQGYAAVAPGLLSQAGERESPAYGRAHTWSERHVAYVSGLGTFGLSGGLITERGQAVRLGSIVVKAQIPPTPRPYTDPYAYCLFYSRGSCGVCARRCPVGSVSERGRDKTACARHLEPATAEYVKQEYGFDGYGCGLCQTAVPCESKIPGAPKG